MKIVVFSPTSTIITPDSIKERPLGGADSTLLRFIDILSQDHVVEAYVPVKHETARGSVVYRHFMDILKQPVECDLLIIYRKAWIIPSTVKYKRVMFYSQDDVDSPCFAGIKAGYFIPYDQVIALSTYHKERIMQMFDVEADKMRIMGNAADMRHPVEKKPLSFIYTSTPFRGLVVLAKMWKQIIAWYPDAELHIFSSMKIYDGEVQDQMYFNRLYEKMQKIKGIIYHGSVVHEEVMQQMERSFMLLYPNTFPETYCNVIMEAKAVMTPFITSDRGALKETGGLAGLYVKGDPYTIEYQQEFLDKVKSVVDNPALYLELQAHCQPIRTWYNYSEDVKKLCNGTL